MRTAFVTTKGEGIQVDRDTPTTIEMNIVADKFTYTLRMTRDQALDLANAIDAELGIGEG